MEIGVIESSGCRESWPACLDVQALAVDDRLVHGQLCFAKRTGKTLRQGVLDVSVSSQAMRLVTECADRLSAEDGVRWSRLDVLVLSAHSDVEPDAQAIELRGRESVSRRFTIEAPADQRLLVIRVHLRLAIRTVLQSTLTFAM